MAIERLTPDHPLWLDFCAHLDRHGLADRVLTPDRTLCPGLYVLCAVMNDVVIGHIVIKMQRMRLPEPSGTGPLAPTPVVQQNRPLREVVVQTFAVDEHYRHQGYGRTLQAAAMELGKRMGCFQIRSWSPLENTAIRALKQSMGFSAHPTTTDPDTGEHRAGISFTKLLSP